MLGVVCMTFTSKVFVGARVDLVEVFIVEVELLDFPDGGFSGVD